METLNTLLDFCVGYGISLVLALFAYHMAKCLEDSLYATTGRSYADLLNIIFGAAQDLWVWGVVYPKWLDKIENKFASKKGGSTNYFKF